MKYNVSQIITVRNIGHGQLIPAVMPYQIITGNTISWGKVVENRPIKYDEFT